MFADADVSDDKFLNGRLRLLQPRAGYRAATDPVLLAAACPATGGESVLDIGCGVGAAALCLGLRVAGVQLTGLEVQPAYADLARRNAARNGMALTVHDGDVLAMPAALRVDFDHVITNPPYYPPGGTPSPIEGRATAMQVAVPLEDWVAASARRLRPGGWMTMICGVDGLPDALRGTEPKLGSVTVLPLAPRQGRAATRLLIRARKGGRAPFRLLAPLVIHAGDAHNGDRESYTEAADAVLRGSESLSAYFR